MPLPPAPTQRANLLKTNKFASTSDAPAAKELPKAMPKEQATSRGKPANNANSSKRSGTDSDLSPVVASRKSMKNLALASVKQA